ncbi:MAG TPA: CPBP family intramembrane glutamic endopeptidase [Stenotrophomonas sp.]|nr:CPBP family intramembrane glutamic endopeptidase [Stenotrophomonas sp.]
MLQRGDQTQAQWLSAAVALLVMAGGAHLCRWPLPRPWPDAAQCDRVLPWLLVAPALGVLLRAGSESSYLLAMGLALPSAAAGELAELAQATAAVAPPWAFWPATLTGALEEEFIYRALLLGYLVMRWHWGLALLASSAVFALPHASPVAFLGGIGLGLIYLLPRNLAVAWLAHVAANLVHPLLQWSGATVDPQHAWLAACWLGPLFVAFVVWASLRLKRHDVLYRPR